MVEEKEIDIVTFLKRLPIGSSKRFRGRDTIMRIGYDIYVVKPYRSRYEMRPMNFRQTYQFMRDKHETQQTKGKS